MNSNPDSVNADRDEKPSRSAPPEGRDGVFALPKHEAPDTDADIETEHSIAPDKMARTATKAGSVMPSAASLTLGITM